MIFFVKEDRRLFGGFACVSTYRQIITKKEYTNFFLVAAIGLIITFIKFSNSGGIATLHLQTLGKFNETDTSSYEGYLSMVFSLFQLLGGVLVGIVLIKKLRPLAIFAIGCVV